MSRRYPPELRARIVDEYATGASTIQLGRAHGVGQSTVLRWLRDAGIERRPAQLPSRSCTIEGCEGKHFSGGYCRPHHSLHVRGHQPRVLIHTEDVEWMAETGETWDRAVERLGVKENTLRRHLERANRYDLIRKLQRRMVAA